MMRRIGMVESGDQNESLDYYYYYFCIPGQVHQFIQSTTSQLWDPHFTLPGCVIKSHRFATLELFYFTVDSKYNFHKITKCSSSVCLFCSEVFSTFLHTFSQSIRATTTVHGRDVSWMFLLLWSVEKNYHLSSPSILGNLWICSYSPGDRDQKTPYLNYKDCPNSSPSIVPAMSGLRRMTNDNNP